MAAGFFGHGGDALAELAAGAEIEDKFAGASACLVEVRIEFRLIGGSVSARQARAAVSSDLWVETISWLLRLFPDTGASSFCRDFGDVSPLALETVFDLPIQQLETIVLRLCSILAPSLSENEEISRIILEQLKDF